VDPRVQVPAKPVHVGRAFRQHRVLALPEVVGLHLERHDNRGGRAFQPTEIPRVPPQSWLPLGRYNVLHGRAERQPRVPQICP